MIQDRKLNVLCILSELPVVPNGANIEKNCKLINTGGEKLFKSKALIMMLCVAGVFIIIFSCTMTKLTAVWKDRAYAGSGFSRVMVVGVSDDLQQRKMFEDAFVKDFKAVGFDAVSSLVDTSHGKTLSRDAVIRSAQETGADAILVAHLIGVEKRSEFVPPMSYPVSYGRQYHFDNYFRSAVDYIHQPERYIQQEYVRLENNLYETRSGKIVWSAVSESIDPGSFDQLIDSLSKAVIKSIIEHKLIR